MRRITIIGNLTADSEIREFSGKKVINFSIAVNDVYKDAQGNRVEKPYYYNCALWRDNSALHQYLKKGIKVFVEGSPEVDLYLDKNKEPKANIKVTVSNVQLLSSLKNNENQQSSITPNATKPISQTSNNDISGYSFGNEDDLPF